MDERDYYGIMILIGMLAVMGIMQSKTLKRHEDALAAMWTQVEFLKIASRETEDRL